MNDNKHNLLDKLADNFAEAAIHDDELSNELFKIPNDEINSKIVQGAATISKIVGQAKLELGKQRHFNTDKIFKILNKIDKKRFIEIITEYTPDTTPQIALQFYRKLSGSKDFDSIKEDALLISLLENINNIDDLEKEISE